MNKKVYLSNLEWTRTHDNMGGVMGNLVFKDNMSYENYQKLTEGFFILCDEDYITNLQQRIYKARKMIFDNYGLLDKYEIEMLDDILKGDSNER